MGITIDDIEALRRRLAELPRNQPREVSKQEAVALLATELSVAKRRGYSPEELAQLFGEHGVAINAATLRGYLRRNRRSRKSRAGKRVLGTESGTLPARTAGGESRPAPRTPPTPPATGVRTVAMSAKDPGAQSTKDVLEGRGTKDTAGSGR